jgi:hypothetical protein
MTPLTHSSSSLRRPHSLLALLTAPLLVSGLSGGYSSRRVEVGGCEASSILGGATQGTPEEERGERAVRTTALQRR